MAMVDIGGARPVEGDRISEINYPTNWVTVYNEKTGKTSVRTLKTMETWELVETLGGSDVFASYTMPDTGATWWLRRSLIRGVYECPRTSETVGEWSIVQMVYHEPLPEPWPVTRNHWADVQYALNPQLRADQIRAALDARDPVHRPAAVVEPMRPVLVFEELARSLEQNPALAVLAPRIESSTRPQAHLTQTTDLDYAAVYLVDVEGQGRPKLLAVVDLPRIDGALGLPSVGSLSFYHDGSSRWWGDKASHAKRFSVSHSESSARSIVEGQSGLVPMTATTGIGLPTIDSTDGEAIAFETEKQEDAYVDLLAELYGEPGFPGGVPGTWLGGYPYQLQDDMQEQCVEMAAKAWGVDSEPEEWRLLLQLASESDANMSWGEDGFLYYWIRESDLAARDFSNVWCILQTM